MILALISFLFIIILYFAFAFFASKKICAICAAVSLTWLGLLLGYFLGWHNDVLLVGILMGGSVVGLMYKIEKYFREKNLKNFWLIRLSIIIFGFLLVYSLLSKNWQIFGLATILVILAAFLSLFFVKSAASSEPRSEESKTLRDKLEHCCD